MKIETRVKKGNFGFLRKRAKRLLAILMSTLMLVGILPQHISEAADSSSHIHTSQASLRKTGV